MKMFHLLLWLTLVFLTACTGQVLTQADRKATEHPKQALTAASKHRRQGDWAAAVKILREAGKRYPDNPRLGAALANLEAAWKREKGTVRARMLLQESRSLSRRLALLRELARLDPNDLSAQTSLLAVKLRMQNKLPPLDRCAARKDQNLTLRRSCAQLALQIEPEPRRQEAFAGLDRKYQAQVARWRARLARKEAEQQAKRRRALLAKAQELLNSGNYPAARPLLEEVLAEEPDNRRATELMIRLQSSLDGQVDALLKLGDLLYREGKLRAAITAWQTALTLAPGQPDAESKIERARHVLEKLEQLRQQQDKGASVK